MKMVVRENCFESDSSSMHSIVVTKNDVHVTPMELNPEIRSYNYEEVYINHHGKMDLWRICDGFGRGPFEILTTFKDKLKYAMCEYLGYLYPDDPEYNEYYDMFKDLCREVIPGFVDFDIRKKDMDIYLDSNGNPIRHRDLEWEDLDEDKNDIYSYLDTDGNRKIAVLSKSDYYEYPNIGCIDHQSMGLLKNFLKDKNITLKEFLTNKKYVVVVDSDECMDWLRYKKSGIINTDFIVEEYDKYGEDIDFMEG